MGSYVSVPRSTQSTPLPLSFCCNSAYGENKRRSFKKKLRRGANLKHSNEETTMATPSRPHPSTAATATSANVPHLRTRAAVRREATENNENAGAPRPKQGARAKARTPLKILQPSVDPSDDVLPDTTMNVPLDSHNQARKLVHAERKRRASSSPIKELEAKYDLLLSDDSSSISSVSLSLGDSFSSSSSSTIDSHARRKNRSSIFRPTESFAHVPVTHQRDKDPKFGSTYHPPLPSHPSKVRATLPKESKGILQPRSSGSAVVIAKPLPSTTNTKFGYLAPGKNIPHPKDSKQLARPAVVPLWRTKSAQIEGESQSRPEKPAVARQPVAKKRAKSRKIVAIPAAPAQSEPHVFFWKGRVKVTIIDMAHKVFVIDLLSRESCEHIRSITRNHLAQVDKSGDKSKSWRTLYTYTKMDLPVCEVRELSVVTKQIMEDVKGVVGKVFGQRKEASKLHPRSWKEPHLLLQLVPLNFPISRHHTGVEMHWDGCGVTWQLMLTDMTEYTGGGTYFRCLQKTIKLRQGQVLCHPGDLYHKGVDITSGVRFLLVCFMDGFDPRITDNSKAANDREEYEQNVHIY